MSPVKSTLKHGLEVLVMGLIVAGLLYFFKDDADVREGLKEAVLAILVAGASMIPKYIRASDSIPVQDYVNKE